MRGAGRRLPGVAALVLSLAGCPPCPGLDLSVLRGGLEEIRFERSGSPVGPGRQSVRIVAVDAPDAAWPARMQQAELRRLRRRGRRTAPWSGLLGGFPAWGLDHEETVPGEARGPARIRKRLRFWALAPGGFLVSYLAEDPGGAGRRRAEKRMAHLLARLDEFSRHVSDDPFRAIRLGEDGARWTETYRFRIRGHGRVEVTGPPPVPGPSRPGAIPFGIWGRQGRRAPADAPEDWYAIDVPGYLVEGMATPPVPPVSDLLARFLGIDSGVDAGWPDSEGAAPGPTVEDSGPPRGDEPGDEDLELDLDDGL